jgi:hypothetical protein
MTVDELENEKGVCPIKIKTLIIKCVNLIVRTVFNERRRNPS